MFCHSYKYILKIADQNNATLVDDHILLLKLDYENYCDRQPFWGAELNVRPNIHLDKIAVKTRVYVLGRVEQKIDSEVPVIWLR